MVTIAGVQEKLNTVFKFLTFDHRVVRGGGNTDNQF